jgi:hypothetical protein
MFLDNDHVFDVRGRHSFYEPGDFGDLSDFIIGNAEDFRSGEMSRQVRGTVDSS